VIYFHNNDGSILTLPQQLPLWKLELQRVDQAIAAGRALEPYGFGMNHRDFAHQFRCQIASRERSLKRQADRERQLNARYGR